MKLMQPITHTGVANKAGIGDFRVAFRLCFKAIPN